MVEIQDLIDSTPDELGVLLVEEDPAEAACARKALATVESPRLRVWHAPTLDDAREPLRVHPINVVVLALARSESQGVDTLVRFRELSAVVPVVVMTGVDDESAGVRALQQGAQGYVTKDEKGRADLVPAVLQAIERQQLVLQLGTARARERHYATHDRLTGLPNRLLFEERLTQAMESAKRSERPLALISLNLDRFKHINATLGHAAGDEFLIAVAGRLNQAVRSSDTAARLGADEFVILCTNMAAQDDAGTVAEKLMASLAEPIWLEGRPYLATASAGVVVYPRDAGTASELLRNADVAMQHAKRGGRNQWAFFHQDMSVQEGARGSLQDGLRLALDNGELELHYQPKIDADSRSILGAEALLRWRRPEGGLVAPMDFLPVLEETGLIVPVGEWVVKTACQEAMRWQEEGLGELHIAVNVSAQQLQSPGFARAVRSALADTGLPAARLELEITESDLVRELQTTMKTLATLKEMGVRIAIDDFGTGYSSLSYLKRLPADVLKIDRSFVCGITSDAADATITAAIVAIAQGLHLQTVAEGVETEEQMESLLGCGCQVMQGFYFSKPLDPRTLRIRLREPAVPLDDAKEEDGLVRAAAS